MAQVSDKTLAWLWSVLQNVQLSKPCAITTNTLTNRKGYHDPRTTYTSTARTLQSYPTLSPRTEVYTHENGSSALLLTLSGTLPVAFRGTTYRYPLKVWIPQSFPQEAPMVYVNPGVGSDMAIRPGQHVGVDGRLYHPVLAEWGRMGSGASGLEEALGSIGRVFEREPPVISRSQQAQFQRAIGGQQHGGAPQPPPKQRIGSPAMGQGGDVPPPRPPKPGEEGRSVHQSVPSRDVERDGPPLPPLPHERQANGRYASARPQQNGYGTTSRPPSQVVQPQGYQNGRPPGPPLPPVPGQQQPQNYPQRQQSQYERSPVSPVSPVAGYSELPETKYSRPAPLPPQQTQRQDQSHYYHIGHPPPQASQYVQQPPQQYQRPPQQYSQQATTQHQTYNYQQPRGPQPQQHQSPQKAPPPPDLLTDPFDIALPAQPTTQHLPAPPIPPNPEKEHLLHALSETLTSQAHQHLAQNTSFLPALHAQHTALQTASRNLEAELRHLAHLDAQIASNESILHASISHCDNIIASTRSKPEPPIDDVLVAPTVVGTQLWNAVAEVEGCREAMDVLQRAMDRGRVGGGDFARQMRALGRERFLKLCLARKCAVGLGLETKGPPVLVGGGR